MEGLEQRLAEAEATIEQQRAEIARLKGAAPLTKTWYDPCPRCGGVVESFDVHVEHVVSNPDALINISDPSSCPHLADPDADCTCTVIPNPAPDPALDQHIPVGITFTMRPCGDAIRAPLGRDGKPGGEMTGWRMYQEETPV